MFWLGRLLVVPTAVVFLLCVAIHLASFFGYGAIEAFPVLWVTHAVVLVLLLTTSGLTRANSPAEDGGLPPSHAPEWIGGFLLALFLYLLVNTGFFIYLTLEGRAVRMDDGSYAISNHGDFVRSITLDEYRLAHAREARGVSGFWIFFSALALAESISLACDRTS